MFACGVPATIQFVTKFLHKHWATPSGAPKRVRKRNALLRHRRRHSRSGRRNSRPSCESLAIGRARSGKAPAGHQAIFLGDLIDRGPGKLETVAIVRGMRDAGEAQCVMGNHEFNAIGYATPRRDEPGEFLRRHNAKNDAQHREFLNQVGEGSPAYLDLLGWFKTLPAFLDLGCDPGGACVVEPAIRRSGEQCVLERRPDGTRVFCTPHITRAVHNGLPWKV